MNAYISTPTHILNTEANVQLSSACPLHVKCCETIIKIKVNVTISILKNVAIIMIKLVKTGMSQRVNTNNIETR